MGEKSRQGFQFQNHATEMVNIARLGFLCGPGLTCEGVV